MCSLDLIDILTTPRDVRRPPWGGERLPSAKIPTQPQILLGMSEAACDAALPFTPWSRRWWVRSVNTASLAETQGNHCHQANCIIVKGQLPCWFRRCYIFLTLAAQWLCSGFWTTAQLIPGCESCSGVTGSGAGCSWSPRGQDLKCHEMPRLCISRGCLEKRQAEGP